MPGLVWPFLFETTACNGDVANGPILNGPGLDKIWLPNFHEHPIQLFCKRRRDLIKSINII